MSSFLHPLGVDHTAENSLHLVKLPNNTDTQNVPPSYPNPETPYNLQCYKHKETVNQIVTVNDSDPVLKTWCYVRKYLLNSLNSLKSKTI